jgi:CRP-like cAMP-binding protein
VPDDAARNLTELALFASLTDDRVRQLERDLATVTIDEGQWIVRRGQTDVGLYIILEGTVGVVHDDEELSTLARGSFFGEISTLLGEPAVADIVARTTVHCLVVPAGEVRAFLLANPPVMLSMLQQEARRLKTADEARA